MLLPLFSSQVWPLGGGLGNLIPPHPGAGPGPRRMVAAPAPPQGKLQADQHGRWGGRPSPGRTRPVTLRPQRRGHAKAGPSRTQPSGGGLSSLPTAGPARRPAAPDQPPERENGPQVRAAPRGRPGQLCPPSVDGRSRWARAFCPASLAGPLPGRVRIPSGALRVVYLWHGALFIAGN